MHEKLDMSQQRTLAAPKAKREREVTVHLYLALVKTHPKYCVQAWGAQHKKDAEILE